MDRSTNSPKQPQQKRSSGKTIVDYWNSFDPTRLNCRHSKVYASRSVGPMARLWRAMQLQERVQVMTRGLREPRAILTGNLVAFDKHWNLILSDTTIYSVALRKSDLTGHGRPGRSQRRRRQRQTRLFREILANGETNEAVKQPLDHPVEIGSLLSMEDIPDEALIWGGDDSLFMQTNDQETSRVACEPPVVRQSTTSKLEPCASNQDKSCGKTESAWTASMAQTGIEQVGGVDSVRSKFSKAQCSESSNPLREVGNVGFSTSSRLSHSTKVPRRGQLFIRGANVVSVTFPQSEHTSKLTSRV